MTMFVYTLYTVQMYIVHCTMYSQLSVSWTTDKLDLLIS